MTDEDGRSEEKTDLWGNKYTQHYDKQGNKVGTSEEKESLFFGDKYIQHYNNDHEKIGTSEEKETLVIGDEYSQHYNNDHKKIGTSEEKETLVFGDEYSQHYNNDHRKIGTSQEKETLVFGDRYTQHYKNESQNCRAVNLRTLGHDDTSPGSGNSSGSSHSPNAPGHPDSVSSRYRRPAGSALTSASSLAKGILFFVCVLYAGQILMVAGSYLTGLPHAGDGLFQILLLIPVGLLGLFIWVAGFLMSLPLFLVEHTTGLCLAFGPGTVLSGSVQVGTISFCG